MCHSTKLRDYGCLKKCTWVSNVNMAKMWLATMPHPPAPHFKRLIVKHKTVECFWHIPFLSGLFILEYLLGTNILKQRHADTVAREIQIVLVTKSRGNKPLCLSRHRWEMDIKDIVWLGIEWFGLARKRD